MPKNSFLQALFPKLKYSVSQINKPVKGNVKIGHVIPVYKTIIQGKESVRLDFSHLLRFAPLNVPVMEGYRVDFDAFKVPVSSLAYPVRKERDVMDFHNLALNEGDVPNPFSARLTEVEPIHGNDQNVNGVSDFFVPRSLSDYLNFPSMKAFRDVVREWINKTPLYNGDFGTRIPDDYPTDWTAATDFLFRLCLNHPFFRSDDSNSHEGVFCLVPFYTGATPSTYADWQNTAIGRGRVFAEYSISGSGGLASFGMDVLSFPAYLCLNYPLLFNYYGLPYAFFTDSNNFETNFYNLLRRYDLYTPSGAHYLGEGSMNFDYLSVMYDLYKIDAQTLFEEYFNYVCGRLLFNNLLFEVHGLDLLSSTTMMDAGVLPNIFSDSFEPIDWTYFAAYWKIISDWYINTNIDGDASDFFLQHFDVWSQDKYVDVDPFKRRWVNDPFTSAVPSSRVTNVLIPADGTIPDLRESNAFQKLKDILRNTGQRLRDVMEGIRGYRPSAEASDMAIPVATKTHYVGMTSVLQTSQTTPESAQAAYAGVGTSRSDFEPLLKVINNDEPTPVVVMVLMSVTQLPSYTQGFPREFFRNNIYDFAIPQLANIGEQEIKTSEVFFDYSRGTAYDTTRIFGFNRRYYDWFFEQAEVHGDLRDSEDVWTGSRVFDSAPVLNSEFIAIDSEKDHLDRIFANSSPEAAKIYYNVVFSGEKIVALPRYIQYEL